MWHSFIIRPIFNLLIILYNIIPCKDMGLAVLALTVLIKLILFPFQHKTSLNQIKMNTLNPKIKEIRKKYKTDLAKQAEEINKLYKEHNIKPLSGIAFMVIQAIIIIALYRVFLGEFSPQKISSELYSFIPPPQNINFSFLGIFDLREKNLFLAFIAAIIQFIQSKINLTTQTISAPKDENKEKISSSFLFSEFQKQLIYIGPIFTLLIVASFPSIVGLYWNAMLVMSIIQDLYLKRSLKKAENLIKCKK